MKKESWLEVYRRFQSQRRQTATVGMDHDYLDQHEKNLHALAYQEVAGHFLGSTPSPFPFF